MPDFEPLFVNLAALAPEQLVSQGGAFGHVLRWITLDHSRAPGKVAGSREPTRPSCLGARVSPQTSCKGRLLLWYDAGAPSSCHFCGTTILGVKLTSP